MASQLANRTAARSGCQPQSASAPTEAEVQRSQITAVPRKGVRWTIMLAGVAVLLAGTLAAKRINFYPAPATASYNTRLAELDTKLSRALASQLRAAGYEFDVAIISVEGPTCRRAVCLVKGLCWEGPIAVRNRITVRHVGNGTWSFAGMGELAGLKFDVDATAEMRRLAESTPPEVPPVALVALTPDQPKPDVASPFARECEVRLFALAEWAQRQWLDLETARCLTEPDRDYFDDPGAYLEWCRTKGLDLSALLYPDQSYSLLTAPMALVPVESKLWKQATPEDIIAHPRLRARPQLRYHFISPGHGHTDTYLFRTEEGTFGILRVLEYNQASRQLRIQYKLARLAATADT